MSKLSIGGAILKRETNGIAKGNADLQGYPELLGDRKIAVFRHDSALRKNRKSAPVYFSGASGNNRCIVDARKCSNHACPKS
jgi:hypothetical protein